MIWMVWLWTAVGLASFCVAVYFQRDRDKYRASAKVLAVELTALRRQNAGQQPGLSQKPLTPAKPKAQDVPKRYTGSQLRRMAEQVNTAAWEGLQERPNSEILQEQNNG